MTETLGGTAGGPTGLPLSMRIEELAQQAARELEAERSMSGDVSALRGEVGALDARLAALEDALNGVADRLEAFAREGASQTADRFEALRAFVADRGADTAATLIDAQRAGASGVMSRVDEAVLGLAGSVREAIDGLAQSVETSLGALGGSVGTALADARDSHADRLDEIVASLSGMRETIVGEVERVRDEATEMLDEVRAQTTEQLETTRTALTDVAGELRETVTTQLDETTAAVTARMSEVKRGVDVASSVLDELRRRVDAATKTGTDTAASVGQLAEDWTTLTSRVVEETRAAAAAQLDEFRERVGHDLAVVRDSLRDTATRIGAAQHALDDGTNRLEVAGTGLLRYLAERDIALETERDRILTDILEEFARGLSKGDRRALAGRVTESLERHRDARDADRWRALQAGQPPAAPVPLLVDSAELPERPSSIIPGLEPEAGPADAADYAPGAAEPAAPVPAPRETGRRPAGAAGTTPPVKAAKPARPAKKAAKAAKAVKAPAKKPAAPRPAATKAAARPTERPTKPAARRAPAKAVAQPSAAPAAATGASAPAEAATPLEPTARAGAPATAVDAFTAALQPRRGRFARRTRS
ncbi:MAG: hypothetical protein ABR520_03315 [Mycobacteriales bacterium]